MARLTQYDYIFAIGTIFAFLDAWNIGANDVANSWATSVASRSVTYIQAMVLAGLMEFTGAVGAGSRVTDTIRTKIVDPDLFAEDPAVLMLGMLCAVIASACFLTFATKIGFPVSTTHSILGGVLGMGIAAVGADDITWVSKDDDGKVQVKSGVVAVFLAWIIAPCISAGFASIIFLITKFGVLLRSNPIMKAFFTIPFYFGVTAALLCMLIITKGGQIKSGLNGPETAGVIVGTGAAWALLICIFLMPWIHRRVIKDDWQLRWYHIPMGPLLLRRGEVPPPPEGQDTQIKNYYEGHLTREELEARRAGAVARGDVEAGVVDAEGKYATKESTNSASSDTDVYDRVPERKSIVGPKPEGGFSGALVFWYLKYAIFRGIDKDVVNMQNEKGVLSGDLEDTHARASHFDNKVEYMFAFLQVMTAATASFTHGANDVANAIGPYASIFQIWNQGALPDKPGVPTWILAFGGVAIMIGLWTYGYHIMKNLGNRLTLQSPSRGFSIELGSAITIILATKLALPISTTQCITGATVGVGLCNGDWRAINWRMVGWIYLGWIITLPLAGIVSGCLMGFIINAPRFGYSS
ncbi:hypothetical protein MKZ38_004211 [Zalerion maritima]|uniref:Phosphate transporter n=1 Tax=Zalerion maritima TaxID=339359 RepID=A0AAD5WQ30_9PEZI|nr:hypothetical protein MKZ38_004211 [Zalerion maritima]